MKRIDQLSRTIQHAALALALTLAPAAAQTPFCAPLRALTQDPTVAAAHWGIQVTDLHGTPLCSVNEAQLFRPASNNKIFTTATALALLGPTHTFETRVTGKLDPATGIVTDLTLLGGGDANLDSHDLPYLAPADRPPIRNQTPPPPFAFHDLEDLAAQLATKGVTSVSGSIMGDDALFPYEPYAESWNTGDSIWGYGAPVSALSIADNQLRLTVTPALAGKPALVTLEQHGVAYYTVQSQVDTFAAKHPLTGVQVERLPGSRTLRVFGSIAADAPPDTEQIAIDDPAAYAAMAFRNILIARGIPVSGGTVVSHLPAYDTSGFLAALRANDAKPDLTRGADCMHAGNLPVLATHRSAPLAQDLVLTNKISQNLHAELLFHQLGLLVFCGQGSTLQAASMVRNYLLKSGLAPNDFLFYDGSGLSNHDLVTPRATAKFLAYAAAQPWFPTWRATLPIGGVDGGLLTRFGPPNSTLKGRVFAKTGTLGESRALSGYVTTAIGQTLIFSIMVDTHLPTTTADRTVMDRIVETIAAQN